MKAVQQVGITLSRGLARILRIAGTVKHVFDEYIQIVIPWDYVDYSFKVIGPLAVTGASSASWTIPQDEEWEPLWFTLLSTTAQGTADILIVPEGIAASGIYRMVDVTIPTDDGYVYTEQKSYRLPPRTLITFSSGGEPLSCAMAYICRKVNQ